ncbi:phosphotransferase [Actinacidiphila bryophytorum]|nr:phosphotransferase [Actinacidiphila bryophytorum]UWE10517.1 phosphotransferase [Actinacidiphila bryophytorum]
MAGHHLGAGGARRPGAGHPGRGVGAGAGRLPDRPAPARSRRRARRAGPRRAAGRHRGGLRPGLASAADLGLVGDPDAVRAVWEDAAAAPEWAGPPMWLHGDLHPANVVTADGSICGVIDFGDLFAGDPAIDLAAAWILLPDGAADLFHRAYGGPARDAATLRRARGWAVGRALACLHIADAGRHGRPGGKPSWGPPAAACLRRLTA